ncbi:MAG TPA: hypothetical protein VN725_07430 [Rhodanobacteraceae bacterium]|nr:hypothetical protein [Rhodanobacteraceae bacterium]
MSKPAPHAAPRDFDFLHGHWRVRNERLRVRLAGCTEWDFFDARATCHPILGGMGNRDEIATDDFGDTHFIGMSLRLFDPGARRWSIWWADNRRGILEPPVSGGFADGTGIFEGLDQHEGAPVRVRFVWNSLDPERPRWEQAFSPDGGATWETNWVMRFERLSSEVAT